MKFLNKIESANKLVQDSSNRLVTDAEKTTWNSKQNALGYTPVNKAGDTMTGGLAVTKITQHPTGVPVTNLGAPSITEMALFDNQFNNKTWFYPPEMFTFEYTSDGDTWLPHNISEGTVKRLVSGNNDANFSIPRDCLQYRIQIDNRNSYVYTNALYMYMSTSGNSTKIVINKKRDDGDWVSHTNSSVNVSGWPGHVYLPYTTLAWSRASTNGHYRYIEILFTPNWNHASNSITIYGLELWGGYPAGSRSIFKWDEDQNVTFPAKLKSVQTNALDTDNTLVTKKYIDDKVKTDVPVGAKFTDTNTTYSEITTAEIDAGTDSTLRTITGRRVKYILDKVPNIKVNNAVDADTVNGKTVLSDVPVNAKFTDTVYTHPTTAGNKHIPTGGAANQFLKYSASGTAVWSALPASDGASITASANAPSSPKANDLWFEIV